MVSFLCLWAGLSKFSEVGNQKGNIHPFLYMLLLSPLSFFLSTFQGEKICEPSLIPQKTKQQAPQSMGHSSTAFLLLAGLSQVQGGVHTVMDKQSDFSRWLPSKFCAGEGEVLQMYKFLGCSVGPLSFQLSDQAHYLPQWWQCHNKCPGAMWLHQWREGIWTISDTAEPAALGCAHPTDRLQKFGQTWVMFIQSFCWKSYTPWQSNYTKRLIILCPKELDVLTPEVQTFMLQAAPKSSMSDSNFSFRLILIQCKTTPSPVQLKNYTLILMNKPINPTKSYTAGALTTAPQSVLSLSPSRTVPGGARKALSSLPNAAFGALWLSTQSMLQAARICATNIHISCIPSHCQTVLGTDRTLVWPRVGAWLFLHFHMHFQLCVAVQVRMVFTQWQSWWSGGTEFYLFIRN